MKNTISILIMLNFWISSSQMNDSIISMKPDLVLNIPVESDTIIVNDTVLVTNKIKNSDIVKTKGTTQIYFTDKIFKFSDYVIKSKVNIFIVSSETCAPCHDLISKVEKKTKSDKKFNAKIKLFIINAPVKRKEPTVYDSIGYQVFKNIDGLSEIFPTTIIFSPSCNQYNKIQGPDYNKIINDAETLIPFCK